MRAQDRQRLGERRAAARVEVARRAARRRAAPSRSSWRPSRELAEREDVDDVAVADLVDRARLGDEPRDHLRVRPRTCGDSTLIATCLPISGCAARYTAPKPPSPSLRLDAVLADGGARRERRVAAGVARRVLPSRLHQLRCYHSVSRPQRRFRQPGSRGDPSARAAAHGEERRFARAVACRRRARVPHVGELRQFWSSFPECF